MAGAAMPMVQKPAMVRSRAILHEDVAARSDGWLLRTVRTAAYPMRYLGLRKDE
jgi:hypothetical protein